ncbi:MAG: hypothetical protein COB59_00945 [Rhodospirillaceae bacterium]|nr:MAG: hypothetical protein COB59_00945 [Rhodospirillaceae bacterium]
MGGFSKTQIKAHQARRTFAMWLAICALVLQTFMPLGQALAANALQNDDFQIICTANGIQQIPTSQNNVPIVPTNSGPCSHCLMHVSAALFTPQDTGAVLLSIPAEHVVAFALPKQQIHASTWRGLPRPSRAPPKFV